VANPAAGKITGLAANTLGDLRGRVFRPDGQPLPFEEWPASRALRGETVEATEMLCIGLDKRRRWLVVRAAPIFTAPGKIGWAVVGMQDITSRKHLERLREEMTAVVAHDLQNPVSAMLLNIGALLKEAPGEEVTVKRANLQRLERTAKRLSEQVHDLLDASRLEAGRMTVDLAPVSPAPAMATLLDQMRVTLGDHPVECHVEEDLPVVAADRVRLDQILTNLLENAAKYSPPCSPIRVDLQARDGGALFQVSDQGPGIPPEEVPRLFDRFYQARRARELKTGLGLGLYITKGLVEAQHGHIQLESVPGFGTTVSVWLPPAPR
jgi:signal transduction histidine kinase